MRHSITALLVIGSLATGCTKQGLKIGLVSAAAIPVGGLIVAPVLDGDGPSANAFTYVGASMLVVGVLLVPCAMLIGVSGWFHERHEAEARETANQQIEIDREHRMQLRERAWALTQTAASAAHAGDCATVKTIEPQVSDLEIEFHDIVFARDTAIMSCLQR